MAVYEGELYGLQLQVTNNSFHAGVPVGANLTIAVDARTPTAVAADYPYSWSDSFGAGEDKGFSVSLLVPEDTSGEILTVTVKVYSPTGIRLAEASANYSIETAPMPSPPPFDPWSYDFNEDGYIDSIERGVAEYDYSQGIISQEQLDMVLALPWLPSYSLSIIPVNLSPYDFAVIINPDKSSYEFGELVTLTCETVPYAEPYQQFTHWVVNFDTPIQYISYDNPVTIEIVRDTIVNCIVGELQLP